MYIDPYPHTNKGKDTHTCACPLYTCVYSHVTRATSQLLYLLNYHVEQAEPWLCPHHHYQGPCSNPRKLWIQWAVTMTTVCHTWDCPGSLRAPQNKELSRADSWREVKRDGHRRIQHTAAGSEDGEGHMQGAEKNPKSREHDRQLQELQFRQSTWVSVWDAPRPPGTAWPHQDLDFSWELEQSL